MRPTGRPHNKIHYDVNTSHQLQIISAVVFLQQDFPDNVELRTLTASKLTFYDDDDDDDDDDDKHSRRR